MDMRGRKYYEPLRQLRDPTAFWRFLFCLICFSLKCDCFGFLDDGMVDGGDLFLREKGGEKV